MTKLYHDEIDTSGLFCPQPLLKAKQKLRGLADGEILRVITTDPSSLLDFKVFAETTGNTLLEVQKIAEKYALFIRKKS
jgi:tRNA 2-thiouridine synthesizing protein A